MKENRTKSQKLELAEKVNKVLNGIRLIENLSNRNNYEYTKKRLIK